MYKPQIIEYHLVHSQFEKSANMVSRVQEMNMKSRHLLPIFANTIFAKRTEDKLARIHGYET